MRTRSLIRRGSFWLGLLPLASASLAVLLLLAASGGNASADPRDAGIDAASPVAVRDSGPAISRTPPDPPAMAESKQWVFDLRWDRGDIYLLEIHQVDMAGPHLTPRVMGRFALELFEGPTLIERARFDFPMLGAGEDPPDAGRGSREKPARFEPKLRTRIGVLFPATKRGTKLELWDRATNVRMPLPWPPTEGTFSADAGPR